MESLTHSDSVVVRTTPEALYDLVSDVTRTGEWSPICRECWWDEGDGPRVGAHFTGRNVTPERTWETRSEVVAAERGREFAWVVGPSVARWSFILEPVEGGTRLTESWEFRPEGQELFVERYGDGAAAQVEARVRAAHEGIPATLAAIARIAEAG
ncbi:SRPBCC family protein [Blastococcus sp. TF02A-26]|uniref:SRPBCC family protein n=1 Tax=Blastococcus sp. TF02A-26 TaxID=2250577 RepID=UPI000DEBD964|nr:SRPBCC family protein [Blastococcus sp. TF02A-26]RBY79961.1 SRPBCC family protein [Blastococcus sp. TF02A-26]